MRKGNLFFLILLVSIFAFSLYALEKQGTPLVKKERPISSSQKGVGGCCKEKEGEPSLTSAPAQKPAELEAKGEKNAPSKREEKKSQSGKESSSDVKPPKKLEKKKEAASEEEEGEEEEAFEEYSDEPEPNGDEDTDFSGY